MDAVPDDAELLRRYAREGAEEAFAEIVRRYVALVYHAALRQTGGDAPTAEDVAQAVFSRLARKAAALAGHHALAGWLHTTTRFAAAEALRSERRRRAREQEAFIMQQLADSGKSDANAAEWEQLRPVIDEALGRLSERDREAVLLRYFAGLPLAQIGARLNVSENGARMRVERALEKLRALLERRGVTSTSAALGVALANQAGAAASAVPAGLAGSVTTAALTSVAGVAVPLAGILGFMSTTKIAVTLGAVLAMAGAGSALYENRHAREAEAALANVRRERDALQTRMAALAADAREAGQRARTSEERLAALQTEVAAARGGKGATRPAAESVATAIGGGGAVNPGMEMMANPEYVRLTVEKFRADLGLKFSPLYKMLRLSPEQIARFEANRTEYQQVTQDVLSAAVAKGVSISDPGMTNLMREPMMNLDKDLLATLGETGYKQYQQYNRAQSGFEVVTALAGNLYRTEAPLNGPQGEQLALAVMNNTRSVPSSPGSKAVRFETDWAAVTAQAQGVLTPSQAAVFETVLAGKKLQQQMTALSAAIRASSGAKPGGG